MAENLWPDGVPDGLDVVSWATHEDVQGRPVYVCEFGLWGRTFTAYSGESFSDGVLLHASQNNRYAEVKVPLSMMNDPHAFVAIVDEAFEADRNAHLRSQATDRGFAHLPAIPGAFADRPHGEVRVYESSAAEYARIWLGVSEPTPAGDIDTRIQLDVAEAWKLAEQLATLVTNHYQGAGLPVNRVFDFVKKEEHDDD